MATQTPISSESYEWAEKHFSGAFSSHKKRKSRIIKFAAAMKNAPGKSIPQLCESDYDVKATYNLFKHPESKPHLIQRGHKSMVNDAISSPGIYLLIEDDSEFSWSGKDPIEGLGPSGDFSEGLQGFMLHTVLAMKWSDDDRFQSEKRPPLEVLGVADQQSFLRRPGKKRTERKQGAPSEGEFKETDPWFHSMERIGTKPSDPGVQWIRVCDRRADIFEQFSFSLDRGYDFIIRSAQDRALENEFVVEESNKSLKEFAQSMPLMGQLQIPFRGRRGIESRTAKINLSAGTVTLRHPYRKGVKASERKPMTLQVVRAWEVGEVPKDQEPIEWLILTSLPICDFDDAHQVIRQYTCRWIIEDFHRALKSGLKAEELQLEHGDRLQAVISIMSIVAVSLVELRELARLYPDAPVEDSNLSSFEISILERRTKRRLQTIEDAVLAIGRLGGHMNRRRDGQPGLVTLWRGWTYMKSLVEGARLMLDNSFVEQNG